MSPQADFVVANGTGAAVRSDINNQLAAIVSNSSGATEPATMYAYQWWADTTTGLLKLRNAANNGWITLFQLDGEWSTLAVENGTAAAPSIYFKDSGTDTGIYSPGTDQVAISTGGTVRLSLSTTAVSSALAIDHPLGAVGTPSITFTGDLNTGIYSPSADQLAIATNGVERVEWGTSEVVFNDGGANYDFRIEGDTNSSLFFVDASAEAVGIGSTAPATQFAVQNASTSLGVEVDTTSGFASGPTLRGYYRAGSAYTTLGLTGSQVAFGIDDVEKARLDASGRLLVGTSTSYNNDSLLQVIGPLATGGVLSLGNSYTPVTSAVQYGTINFISNVGSVASTVARINAENDGDHTSATDKPTRLVFSTCADEASSPTERFRIGSAGQLGIGGATYGTSGQVLTSGGASAAPSWTTIGSAAGTLQAWVNFNGTGTVAIRASGNVSSITDNGVGDYTVNFTTALADADYSVVATGQEVAGPSLVSMYVHRTSPYASGSIRLQGINTSGASAADTAFVNVAIFR
jgi:hypothetical protein